MKAKNDSGCWSKAEKVGLILTASIALGGMYGSVSDRLSAVEVSSATTEAWKSDTESAICEQGKKLDVIIENTNDLKSDMKLLKATKADKKMVN